MSAGAGRERLWTGPFVLCFVTNLCQGTAFNLFLHLPGYLHDLGANDVQIGGIASLTALAAVACRPPVGRAMDRLGRCPVIRAGGALHALATALYLAVDSIGPLLYAARSPIHHLERLRRPVIFFQGLEDRVVPPAQAEGMAAALAARGVPHALVCFADEGHGFRRTESIERALAAELWFYGRVLGFEVDTTPEPAVELR